MGWEQHRYAVERARDMRRKIADEQNDHCAECGQKTDGTDAWRCGCPTGQPIFAGATLQGEASSSDAEMLDEVADFMKSLEGSKAGQCFADPDSAFVADWNQTIVHLSNFCSIYALPKPDMIFHPNWQGRMSEIAGMRIGSPIIYAGVRVRFGTLTPMDVLRT